MNSLIETLADPAARHAIFGHAPIVLIALALVLALASAFRTHCPRTRSIAVACFVLLAVAAFVTVKSGEAAKENISVRLTDAAYEALERHEQLAERVWPLALAAALALGLGFASPRLRAAGSWFGLALGIVCAGWIGWTAHHGGLLVYAHGVGAPSPGLAALHARPSGTGAGSPAAASDDPRLAFFEDQVVPLLAGSCWGCHNPAGARDHGRLDQTSMAGMLRGGLSGPALVPGSPERSLIIERVRSDDPELVMPQEGERLSPAQIAVLERWIREGAVWSVEAAASAAATIERP